MKVLALFTLAGLAMALPSNVFQAVQVADIELAAAAGAAATKSVKQEGALAQAQAAKKAAAASKAAAAGCDAATAMKVAQLAGGISSNIGIQIQELAGIKALQALVSANTTKPVAVAANSTSNFEIQRMAVLQIQQNGVDLRTGNQKIAAELKSAAIDGLNTVQKAQLTEIDQVKSLTGGGAADEKTLQTLVQEVEDGTKQNMKNLAAAEAQCM